MGRHDGEQASSSWNKASSYRTNVKSQEKKPRYLKLRQQQQKGGIRIIDEKE